MAVANFGRRRVAFAWAVAAAAALLSPLPPALTELAGETPAGLPLDKLAHVALFALLGRAWLRAAGPRAVVALAAVAYGGLLELAQGSLVERSGEALDVVANALGVAIAFWMQRRT